MSKSERFLAIFAALLAGVAVGTSKHSETAGAVAAFAMYVLIILDHIVARLEDLKKKDLQP